MAMSFTVLLSALFSMLLSAFSPMSLDYDKPPGQFYGILIERLAMIPALIAAGVWALKVFERLPARALGIVPEGAWLRQLLLGIAAGLLLIGAVLGLLRASGMAVIHWQGTGKEMLLMLGEAALFMLLVGLAEELLVHGYLFQTLLRGIGPLFTLLLTSLLFACLHLFNPDRTLLSMTNIFLVGVLFGLLYLRSGSLWLPIGLHAGWNFAQVLFHVPVSGMGISFSTPFLTELTGQRLVTGGAFGPEGGIVVSAVLLGMITLVVYGRFGLPLDSRWWEWRGLARAPEMPQNWDFSVDSRYYQWKLLGHDQSE